MSEHEYYVVQSNGFDSGRVYDGPYEQFTEAYKVKNKREEVSMVNFKVCEVSGEGHFRPVEEQP